MSRVDDNGSPILAKAWLASSHKVDLAVLLLLCALAVFTWLPRLKGPIDLRWDGGTYYVLGTSLAQGKGYKLLNEPGEIDAVQYPPLLPAIVAAHQLVLGTDDPAVIGSWLRYFFFLVFIACILASYVLSRIYLPVPFAFLATIVCLFNLHTYFLSDLCFPEILFELTTVLFFLLKADKREKFFAVWAPVLAIISYGLRSIGIALLAAWVGESLLNRQFKKAALRIAISAIPVLCWQGYILHVESGTQYKQPAYAYQRADYMFYNVSYARNISLRDPFAPEKGYLTPVTLARRVIRNAARMPITIGEAVSVDRGFWTLAPTSLNRWPYNLLLLWLVPVVLFVIGCLVMAGIVQQLLRREWIMPLYILFYLGAVCMTPWPGQFTRYLVPLSPLLSLSLFRFFLSINNRLNRVIAPRWKRVFVTFMVGTISLILAVQILSLLRLYRENHQPVVYHTEKGERVEYRLFFYYDSDRALDEGLDWLKGRAQSDEIVAASMPHWVYLRTGLKTVMIPFVRDPAEEQLLLDSVPVRYLILNTNILGTDTYTTPLIERFPERWQLVYSAPQDRLRIYRRANSEDTPVSAY